MSRMKSLFAVLLLTAIAGVVPQAHAAPVVKISIAGSSAMWQGMALAAYNGNNTQGNCLSGGTAPCFHYTSTSNSFNLIDSRPVNKGGSAVTDTGTVWIVWDSSAGPNIWVYIKVDSVVGDRCYFARPQCTVSVVTFPAVGNQISSTLWGDNSADQLPPTAVQNLFLGAGVGINTAATDIRPEDGMFAQCRANSALGGGVDGLAGLGYGANAAGVCPSFGAPLANLVGTAILSGYPGSTAKANNLAFNISGTDPFSNTAIPAATTVSVGAAPLIFVTSRSGALASVANATEAQLQTVFGGINCDASVFGAAPGVIEAYLREMTSGTMNATEYTVFRYPNFSGVSQETGVNASNPLAASPCGSGGNRYRGIGTGEVVKSVLNSNANNGHDGIAYTFFSYGNVSTIANSASYGYLTLNGVDGIFHKYGTTIDPGQPTIAGALPAAANLPASCASGFPCPEKSIWSGNLSFPNLRNGSYRAWSILRLVSNGTALATAKQLATGAQAYAANSVPDFVPAVKVGATDPGLALLRSHYTQEGVAPVNVATSGDKGGDAGGCILTSTGIVATSDTTIKLAQAAPDTGCVSVP